jgi:outer membrane protein assembly factor BamB
MARRLACGSGPGPHLLMPPDDAGTRTGRDAFNEHARSQAEASRARRRAAAERRRGTRRSRLVVVLAFLVIVVLGFLASGSSHRARSATTASEVHTIVSVTPSRVGTLPAAVQDSAVAALGGERLALLGGLSAGQTSTAAVSVLSGGSVVASAALPEAQHDAQAAALAGAVYVFGGGQVSSYDHILRYDAASGSVTVAGTLPSAASDVAVATIGETAYIVGGYDGVHFLHTILAWRPGSTPRVVGLLPQGLRYAAVADAAGRLLIAGGTTEAGASDAILRFTPSAGAGEGTVSRVGTLPTPLTHASAVTVGGRIYIVGGREQVSGGQTAAVLALDASSGTARRVGTLPQPLSDAAVLAQGSRVLVLGGESTAGTQSAILALTPHVRQVVVHPPSPAALAKEALAALEARGFGAALKAHPASIPAYEAAAMRPGLPGYLLIADRGNNRILVVDPQGHVVWQYPNASDLAAGRRLHFNDDTFVEPGGQALIANEEDNDAIVSINIATHQLEYLFGHPGVAGGGRVLLNYPDDAYMFPDGSFTVADAYNCRILVVRAHAIVREIGRSGVCRHEPPRYFGAVNGDTPTPEGGFLVSEINGHWVDSIAANGALQFAVQAPVSYPSDPQPLPGGRVLLADYASPGHVVITDRLGDTLWRYGPSEGEGMLNHPSLAFELPNGDIAVNDDYRERVVIIDPHTKRIVWQYGHTGASGTAPGYLNTPDGMDFIPSGPHGELEWSATVHP